MSLKVVRAAAKAEYKDDIHLARLLLLLTAFDRGRGKQIDGIMKLAKLDFLLRYPNCLEKTLGIVGIDTAEANIADFERHNIEAKMYRFRYGPWDDRYRRWIGILLSKDLATTFLKGNTVYVGITNLGKEVADALSDKTEFADLRKRTDLVVKAVGDFSGTRLKNFVYANFPEIVSMKWGEDIKL